MTSNPSECILGISAFNLSAIAIYCQCERGYVSPQPDSCIPMNGSDT